MNDTGHFKKLILVRLLCDSSHIFNVATFIALTNIN